MGRTDRFDDDEDLADFMDEFDDAELVDIDFDVSEDQWLDGSYEDL